MLGGEDGSPAISGHYCSSCTASPGKNGVDASWYLFKIPKLLLNKSVCINRKGCVEAGEERLVLQADVLCCSLIYGGEMLSVTLGAQLYTYIYLCVINTPVERHSS